MKKDRANDHSKYQNWIDPNDCVPYEKNAKKHDKKQIDNIANSIKRFGWQQDVVLTTDNVLVIGHGRRLAAIQLGCQMPYHRIDKDADHLTEVDIRELRIADNQTNAETGFDFPMLFSDMNDLSFDGFDFDFPFLEEMDKPQTPHDGDDAGQAPTEASEPVKPVVDVKIPQYVPSGNTPTLFECCDAEKAHALIDEINRADITQEEKDFLTFAAYRHLVFNYRNIADYYANASAKMQRLMEKSALVIIDVKDAIANGYAKLQSDILAVVGEDGSNE